MISTQDLTEIGSDEITVCPKGPHCPAMRMHICIVLYRRYVHHLPTHPDTNPCVVFLGFLKLCLCILIFCYMCLSVYLSASFCVLSLHIQSLPRVFLFTRVRALVSILMRVPLCVGVHTHTHTHTHTQTTS
jgi:hypothetical protein